MCAAYTANGTPSRLAAPTELFDLSAIRSPLREYPRSWRVDVPTRRALVAVARHADDQRPAPLTVAGIGDRSLSTYVTVIIANNNVAATHVCCPLLLLSALTAQVATGHHSHHVPGDGMAASGFSRRRMVRLSTARASFMTGAAGRVSSTGTGSSSPMRTRGKWRVESDPAIPRSSSDCSCSNP